MSSEEPGTQKAEALPQRLAEKQGFLRRRVKVRDDEYGTG